MEQLAGGVIVGLGLAVLPGGVVLGLGDLAPQQVGHQLAAVADAQNGHAPGENFRVHLGGGVQIHAVGAAGEDDADGIHGLQLREGSGVGLDFAVHAALPHPAGNELVVLSAEVQHDNSLMRHKSTLSKKFYLRFTPGFLLGETEAIILKKNKGGEQYGASLGCRRRSGGPDLRVQGSIRQRAVSINTT